MPLDGSEREVDKITTLNPFDINNWVSADPINPVAPVMSTFLSVTLYE